MVSAVSRNSSADTSRATPRRSPVMDAQLATARAKLEDWVTCPSAKTPAGKAEIEKASAKLETIKAEIKKVDAASEQTRKTDSAAGNVVTEAALRNRSDAPLFSAAPPLGARLNALA